MPALLARAVPFIALLLLVWAVGRANMRVRSAPLRVTRQSVMLFVIIVLLAVIAYLVMR